MYVIAHCDGKLKFLKIDGEKVIGNNFPGNSYDDICLHIKDVSHPTI